MYNSTCQLTGAIMSTRSRANFLLEAVCFILLASSASWLGGTRVAVPCARASQPTTWRHTLPTTGTNPSHTFQNS